MSKSKHIAILGADRAVMPRSSGQPGWMPASRSSNLRPLALVDEAAMAMEIEAGMRQMAAMIHAHSTMAEGFMEAAEDAEGKSYSSG